MFNLKRKSIVSQIIILFFIINIISLAFFTLYLYQQDMRINTYYIEESIQEVSKEKAHVLAVNLDHIKAESENLAYITKEYLLSTDKHASSIGIKYQRDVQGILGRNINKTQDENRRLGISNIYLPKNVELTPKIEQEILKSEKLDTLFNQVLNRNKYIQWVYLTTESSMMRISPYITNSAYEPDHDQRSDVFYTTANKKNNPTRKTVWTPPYFDYLLTGWMITCSTPIYDGNRLLGVLSLDLRLDTLREDILADFRVGDTGFAFLIDNNGNIIYHPDVIEMDSQQGVLLKQSIFDQKLTNAQKKIVENMMRGSTGIGRYRVNGDPHLIAYSQIPDQGWSLGIDVNENNFLISNKAQTSRIYVFLTFSLFLFSALSIFVYRQYSRPFRQLTDHAQNLSDGIFDNREIISNFQEIEILSSAFNTMSDKLKSYTESLLRRSNQIETVFNSIGGLLMILTPEQKIKMLNKKGYYRFGKLDKEIIGTYCFKTIAGQNSSCNNCGFKEVLSNGKPVYKQIGKGNEIFSNAYYPIINKNGNIEEIIVYSQNITDRILMEKELAQAEKLAGVGQLSSAIAHELKNPLAIMKGASYLLRKHLEKDALSDIMDNINTIDSSIINAENVILNLLEFSAKSKHPQEIVDIEKIVDQILLLEKRNITKNSICTDILFNPSPFVINCQADAIKHILLNLISNAIQAMPKGGILTIRGEYCPTDDEKIILSIIDNGLGIPFYMQSEIFKPFFTAREGGGGTGLGLWITKLAVEKLSGEISMQSIPGKGTTFTTILPTTQKKES